MYSSIVKNFHKFIINQGVIIEPRRCIVKTCNVFNRLWKKRLTILLYILESEDILFFSKRKKNKVGVSPGVYSSIVKRQPYINQWVMETATRYI